MGLGERPGAAPSASGAQQQRHPSVSRSRCFLSPALAGHQGWKSALWGLFAHGRAGSEQRGSGCPGPKGLRSARVGVSL